jgi:hypothetical protein
MLDTELKVDQFLVALKAEIMGAKMSEGEYGPWVTIEVKEEGSGYSNSNDKAYFFRGTNKKIISVNIFEDKKPLILCGGCVGLNKA